MYKFKKPIVVICEGKSEGVYIQELNKYLKDKGIYHSLSAKQADMGHFKEVKKKYDECKKHGFKKNREKDRICIWVDKDIYVRNESNNNEKYKSKKGIPDFHFNEFNFEDFLTLHCPKYIVLKWQDVCNKNNHFGEPMKWDKYSECFKKFWQEVDIQESDEPLREMFKGYKKGSLPSDFISDESLKRLFENNKDKEIKFRSDFTDIIKTVHPDAAKTGEDEKKEPAK